MQVQQQEETLDVLHESVGRLKNLGVEMSNEISTQKRMLSDLEGQVEAAATFPRRRPHPDAHPSL